LLEPSGQDDQSLQYLTHKSKATRMN